MAQKQLIATKFQATCTQKKRIEAIANLNKREEKA